MRFCGSENTRQKGRMSVLSTHLSDVTISYEFRDDDEGDTHWSSAVRGADVACVRPTCGEGGDSMDGAAVPKLAFRGACCGM